MQVDVSSLILADCEWAVANAAQIHYSEWDRQTWVGKPRRTLPITADCSSFDTMLFVWNGAPNPSGDPNLVGDTETFLARGERVTLATIGKCGLIVYGYPGVLSSQHVAMVYEINGPTEADIIVCSHGQESDPRFVSSVLEHPGQPRAFLRFSTLANVPNPPAPKPPEDDMIWLDADPNNQAAILVVPGRGGWYGLDAGTLAYFKANGVPTAKVKISKAEFNNVSFQKLGTI